MVRNRIRGVLLVLVGLFAFYMGAHIWQVHPGLKQAWFEFALGVIALALGSYLLVLKPKAPSA
jgi:hypothetical protein